MKKKPKAAVTKVSRFHCWAASCSHPIGPC